MKFLKLNDFLRISMLTLALTLSTSSVDAQNVNAPPTERVNNARANNTDKDHDSEWGWIGLLGLLGLAGLLPKKRVVDHDRIDTGNRTAGR